MDKEYSQETTSTESVYDDSQSSISSWDSRSSSSSWDSQSSGEVWSPTKSDFDSSQSSDSC